MYTKARQPMPPEMDYMEADGGTLTERIRGKRDDSSKSRI